MSYVHELSRELARVGITGRLRRRIATEIGDHLACDPGADLGRPAQLARGFADELGTRRARRAAVATFAALAFAGLLFAVAFLTSGRAGPDATLVYASSPLLGYLGRVLLLLAPQLAFVTGSLAALRAFARRGAGTITRSEATIIGRRATLALASGLASMAGLALVAIEFQDRLAAWWTSLALGSAAIGICALVLATPSVISALRLRPVASGAAGDVFDDLGELVPVSLRGRPWTLALLVSLAVAWVITLGAVAQADAIDGVLRGLADALACVAGFALLGPWLGLRAARDR